MYMYMWVVVVPKIYSGTQCMEESCPIACTCTCTHVHVHVHMYIEGSVITTWESFSQSPYTVVYILYVHVHVSVHFPVHQLV